MSTLYTPDPAINSTFTVQLSQRDLSLRVPINYVTHAGVALSAACFGSGRYEETAAAKCFSNLLVSGFRRLEVDVYWDASRSVWSLCPVELGGGSSSSGGGDGEVVLTSSTSVVATGLPTGLARRDLRPEDRDRDALLRRQTGGVLSATSEPATTVTTSQSISKTATLDANPMATSLGGETQSTDTNAGDGTLFTAGDYACTASTDFALLISIISAHVASTDTNIAATIAILSINVHAASPASTPQGPARQPSDIALPDSNNLLSSIITRNVSSYVYTPRQLSTQRDDLNSSSWFTSYQSSQPISEYFAIVQQGNTPTTSDGWPNEGFLETPGYAKRLLVEYGSIDPQMSRYNFSGDSSTIFPADYLSSARNVTYSGDGGVVTGCFFNPADTAMTNSNSSWAITTVGQGESVPREQVPIYTGRSRNLTNCGISPTLNATLGNVSADADFTPYRNFALGALWSWGPNEPVNASREGLGDFRCAALNATSGAWKASDCSVSRHGACRVGSERYVWQISGSPGPYERVNYACDQGQEFDAPRTALENQYLLSSWRSYRAGNGGDDVGELLWLNFNDLEVEACWVVGQNATCPYDGPPEIQTRRIVVPVVAGVIVFVLTVLTVCVKCAGSRQMSKRRRRRGEDGWDYEGVPS